MTDNHVCVMCADRGKTWEGSNPVCAFDDVGKFSADNWNCATMNKLRDIADANGLSDRDDNAAASIGAVPFEGDDYSGYIVMTWYKNRGRTGNALIMWDDEPARELTEADARLAIAQAEADESNCARCGRNKPVPGYDWCAECRPELTDRVRAKA